MTIVVVTQALSIDGNEAASVTAFEQVLGLGSDVGPTGIPAQEQGIVVSRHFGILVPTTMGGVAHEGPNPTGLINLARSIPRRWAIQSVD